MAMTSFNPTTTVVVSKDRLIKKQFGGLVDLNLFMRHRGLNKVVGEYPLCGNAKG